MKIILKVSMPILIGLMFYGCQRDFEVFSPQGLEANKKHREQDAIKRLFERSYKHGELRSLKPQGMLDYSDFTVHWEPSGAPTHYRLFDGWFDTPAY